MSKAIIVSKSVKGNSREAFLQLRSGAKGTGRIIHSVRYWPWSGKSEEAAYRAVHALAEREGIEVVPAYDEEER